MIQLRILGRYLSTTSLMCGLLVSYLQFNTIYFFRKLENMDIYEKLEQFYNRLITLINDTNEKYLPKTVKCNRKKHKK